MDIGSDDEMFFDNNKPLPDPVTLLNLILGETLGNTTQCIFN